MAVRVIKYIVFLVMASFSVEAAPLYSVKPIYPKEALENCIEGSVVLSFIVTEELQAVEIKVRSSTPVGMFDTAAIHNLKKIYVKNYADSEKLNERIEDSFSFNIGDECEGLDD